MRMSPAHESPKFPLRSAFLALPLENEAKWQFQALQLLLEPYRDILTFQNPQSPHLTLIFWKELLEIEYQPMLDQAAKIASKSESFSLMINGADTFGKAGDERVLFLTVEFSPQLATLKKLCPWPQVKEFHPHITIARVKHSQKFNVHKKKIMKVFEGVHFPMMIDRLRLYGEIEGRKQTVLQDFLFGS